MKTVTFRHYINHEVDSICQTDKFSDMPIVFLLVTDIDVNKQDSCRQLQSIDIDNVRNSQPIIKATK